MKCKAAAIAQQREEEETPNRTEIEKHDSIHTYDNFSEPRDAN